MTFIKPSKQNPFSSTEHRLRSLEQRVNSLPVRFPRGGGAAPLRVVYVLGGQFDNDDVNLPVMRYASEETKPAEPPELPTQATVTLAIVSGEVTVASFTPGSGYTGDEATTVTVQGDGTSATLTISYDNGAVDDVTVAATSDDWTEASAVLPQPLGFVDTVTLPDGYGIGAEINGESITYHIISFWGDRVTTPRWVLPGGTVQAPGYPLLIIGSQTEIAADDEPFSTVLVRGI
jgi:hypothetical protein